MPTPAIIPLLIPDMPSVEELIPWLTRIDAHRHYTNFGPLNAELCDKLARAMSDQRGPCHATTFSNGTAALTAWLTHSIGPAGRLVLIPGLTFVASAQAVIASGNIPLLADVDSASWLLMPDSARDVAERHPIAAVLPVAAFGTPCHPDAWDAFVRDTGIPVLVDAAGAFGNQRVGALTDIAVSLHTTKALAAGEGGAIVSADAGRIEALTRLTNFGIDLPSGLVTSLGINAKLSEYHAAVGLASFARWPRTSHLRKVVMARYQQLLATHCPDVALPVRDANGVYTLLATLLPDGVDAGDTCAALARHGIQSRRWYCPPIHRHPTFAELPHATPLDMCETLGERLLGLPFFPSLSADDCERVVVALAASCEVAV